MNKEDIINDLKKQAVEVEVEMVLKPRNEIQFIASGGKLGHATVVRKHDCGLPWLVMDKNGEKYINEESLSTDITNEIRRDIPAFRTFEGTPEQSETIKAIPLKEVKESLNKLEAIESLEILKAEIPVFNEIFQGYVTFDESMLSIDEKGDAQLEIDVPDEVLEAYVNA